MKGKRFIAGAVCPACQATDRLFVREMEDGKMLQCLDCGYKETMSETTDAQSVPTRLDHDKISNKSNGLSKKDDGFQKIRIIGFSDNQKR